MNNYLIVILQMKKQIHDFVHTEAYCQILPGMSAQLYPRLIADSSLDTHVPDNEDTLQMQLTSEVDKYLQEVAERHEMDVSYFDG